MTDTIKELMTLPEFLARFSISRTTAYREIGARRLQLTKVGRRSYIARQDASAWLESLRHNQSQQSI